MPPAQDENLAMRGVPSLELRIPDPLRKLGFDGGELWTRLWQMRNPGISMDINLDHVTLLCESIDVRVALRQRVLADGDWRDRVALRARDGQIDRMMGALGLNPTDRATLEVGEAPKGRLAELRASRASRACDPENQLTTTLTTTSPGFK